MKIELVLLGLIAVVLIVDFILRGIKKRKKSSFNEIEKPEESENKIVKKTSILRFILFLLSSVLLSFILTIIVVFALSLFIDKIDNNTLFNLLIELFTLESNSGFYSNSIVFSSLEYYIINLSIIIFIITIIIYIAFKNLKSMNSHKKNIFNYISSRKRNLVSFIILVHILKILIHYFFYRTKYPDTYAYNKKTGMMCEYDKGYWDTSKCLRLDEFMDFIWHIENIYFSEVWLLIASFIILGVLVWLFNDKIKSR